ncbi:MAG TPA: hypothetical protein DF715_05325 [Oceanicaulis sp.]|jgi:hypothetical protein|uniref:Uncharacterized protein n=1 Tax=Glycocaulis albus TaxID=1382801 RepID=A0ABQ1Y1Q0_9PROT|nr:hypothetical protein [Glycocaulis albus]MBV5257250.1 hypothetical protein [Synechococcus moorigangaii CMS01]GGH08892.1 hypothetical protein GCM10007420_27140 [Glycocaulis albus]HCY54955.1 hypothetical protein [Oceanicaulis sp.]
MTRFRIMLWIAFAGVLALGLGAGGFSLAIGMVDQAIAFTWPSAGAALAIALLIPAARRE